METLPQLKRISYEKMVAIRRQCNYILSNVVELHSKLHPELRFIQNLWALRIVDNVDRFSEEPYETIIRIYPKIEKLINEECETIAHKLCRINIKEGIDSLINC